MLDWQKVSQTEQKFGYRWQTEKVFTMPDGTQQSFTTLGRVGTRNVATVALTKDGQVVIARQFRPGPEKVFDELPGGGVNKGEDIAVAAARELMEETGYAPGQPLEYLGAIYRDAYTNEVSNYFLARDCTKVAEVALDEGEYVETVLITIEQLISNARNGAMSDGGSVLLALDKLNAKSL